MKKIIALVLALIMMASMSVVAFAAVTPDISDDDLDDGEISTLQTGPVKVEYTVTKGYLVVIPDDITLELNERKDGTTFGTSGYTVTNVDAETPTLTVMSDAHPNAVSIMSAKISAGETLNVSVSGNAVTGNNYLGQTISNKWMLKEKDSKSASIGYDIKVTGYKTIDELAQNVNVVEYVSGTTAIGEEGRTSYMSIVTEQTNQPGKFQDTLTFKVQITSTNA